MNESVQLQELADVIGRRGFSDSAIFFLEMYKPLAGFGRECMAMAEPLGIALFGSRVLAQLREILKSQETIEQLIRLLEASREKQ
jgi:hypothetical protein